MTRCYLHLQHRPRRGDYGAVFDLDRDGLIEPGERERDLIEGYARVIAEVLRGEGVEVVVLDSRADPAVSEHYPQVHQAVRVHAWANPCDRGVYLACHVNAGGGDYGLVGYDVRSSGGKRAGALISARLDEALTECRRVRIEAMQDGSAISPKGWSCIAGIFDGPPWLCGVLLEPGFLDAPEHATLWDSVGLARIGQAVADGVLDYLEG